MILAMASFTTSAVTFGVCGKLMSTVYIEPGQLIFLEIKSTLAILFARSPFDNGRFFKKQRLLVYLSNSFNDIIVQHSLKRMLLSQSLFTRATSGLLHASTFLLNKSLSLKNLNNWFLHFHLKGWSEDNLSKEFSLDTELSSGNVARHLLVLHTYNMVIC